MDYLNTNAYDCDIDMMSQPYDESGYQHVNEDMDDLPGQEGRSNIMTPHVVQEARVHPG